MPSSAFIEPADMNKHLCTLALLVASSTSLPAWADLALATAKNCMACHATDTKLVGPAYKDVAAKYKGDAKAPAMLAEKIKAGGKGVWGQVPMPPNNVTPEEASKLAAWVLAQK